mmetsp:Transcript_56016/g.121893  ORF Transcript_56016/g.121893 Transcript_56016/m.121893 type:complete len:212 (+) Transcript_56016:328-963(+)
MLGLASINSLARYGSLDAASKALSMSESELLFTLFIPYFAKIGSLMASNKASLAMKSTSALVSGSDSLNSCYLSFSAWLPWSSIAFTSSLANLAILASEGSVSMPTKKFVKNLAIGNFCSIPFFKTNLFSSDDMFAEEFLRKSFPVTAPFASEESSSIFSMRSLLFRLNASIKAGSFIQLLNTPFSWSGLLVLSSIRSTERSLAMLMKSLL